MKVLFQSRTVLMTLGTEVIPTLAPSNDNTPKRVVASNANK